MMLSFRKVHWVFFLSLELRSSFEKKNSMDFPSGQHHFASGQHHHITFVKKNSNISSSGQKRVWLSFETTSFCRRRKKIDKKILHPSVSQSSHDLLGNKSPLSHFSSWTHISSTTPSYIHRTLPFSIFCYLTKLIFFPFCWILNAGNGVFNRWFNWFSNLHVKKC